MTNTKQSIPILAYHEVVEDDFKDAAFMGRMPRSYFVRENRFNAQMRLLWEKGIGTISLYDLLKRIARDARNAPAEQCVVITFDDGYQGNYRCAYPVLRKYGLSATFFVAVEWIGRPLMMSWRQLKEMSDCGMSIQSHTLTHRFLRQLGQEEVATELRESKRVLEENLGKAVDFLSLPHGSYGRMYKEVAIATGYKGGCSSRPGLNDGTVDPYFLRRLDVTNKCSLDAFRRIVEKDRRFVRSLTLKKRAKQRIRELFGERAYKRVYDLIFRVKEASAR